MARGRDDERTDEFRPVGPLDEAALDRTPRNAPVGSDELEILELPPREAPSPDPRGHEVDRDKTGDGGMSQSERRMSVPVHRLLLPDGVRREGVTLGKRTVFLRGSEVRLLATVGAFRVIPEVDLARTQTERSVLRLDLRRLAADGLVQDRVLFIDDKPTRVVVLTRSGMALLEEHREQSAGEPDQTYYAGFTNRRDLPHDAELFRVYQAVSPQIEADGGRVVRVVLDMELRRDYVAFLKSAPERDPDDQQTFADAFDLPVVDGRVRLPDLRIEYELEGRLQHRDLEWMSKHYYGVLRGAKGRAGFALYGGHGARRGGVPYDPGHARRIG